MGEWAAKEMAALRGGLFAALLATLRKAQPWRQFLHGPAKPFSRQLAWLGELDPGRIERGRVALFHREGPRPALKLSLTTRPRLPSSAGLPWHAKSSVNAGAGQARVKAPAHAARFPIDQTPVAWLNRS
jgi:hypothetical protein